jgi:hypothetical protein
VVPSGEAVLNNTKLIASCCLLSLVFGFAGSAVSIKLHGYLSASPEVLTAKAVVIVDDSGSPLSYWGRDNSGGMTLVFYSKQQQRAATFGIDNQKSPFLEFRGKDNVVRGIFHYDLGEKPSLVLLSPSSQSSLFLGEASNDTPSFPDSNGDNWALVLRRPDGRAAASVEMAKDPLTRSFGGEVSTVDSAGRPHSLSSAK